MNALGIVFLSTFHIEFFKQICLLHSSDVMFSDHNLNQAPELQIDIEDDGKRRDPEIQIQNVIFSRKCRLIAGLGMSKFVITAIDYVVL
jgi:hypothetical protein